MSTKGIDLPNLFEQVNSVYETVKQESKAIRDNPNFGRARLWSYLDHWDEFYTQAAINSAKVNRKFGDAKDQYDDNLRQTMRDGGRSQIDNKAYDERRAEYETLNLGHLKELRKWEKARDEYISLLRFLRHKMTWLDSKIKNVVRSEVREESLRAKDFHVEG